MPLFSNVGVTVTIETRGVIPAFAVVKEGKFPVPEVGDNPIGVSITHE